MITYSVNGNIVKHNNLSAKSNRIIEAMTEQETELNMTGSLNISGTVKAAKFMTADGTIIDIADTNNKLKELGDNRVTPQEYKDLRDEMLQADQEFANKSEMSNLVDQISALKTADQGFATKDNLVEVSTSLKDAIQSIATATQSVANSNSNNDLHNKERAGNVADTIPAKYNPTMELKQFHSTNKDSTIGYGGSSIQFSTNNGENGGGQQWPTGSIVGSIDPDNSSGYQGGFLFYTAAGGLNKPQKLTMSMGGPDQRAYFAGNVGIGTKNPKEKLEVNGTVRIQGSEGKFNATGEGSQQLKKEYIQFASNDKPNSSDGARFYAEGPSNKGKLVLGIQDDLQREESFLIRGEHHNGTKANDIAEFTADGNLFTNNVTFKKNGTDWWHRTNGDAAIVNADNYNTLMMVGREHEGTRKIGMWDTVDVNGTLNVNGNLKVNDKVINLEEDDDAKIVPKSYWMSYYNSNSSGNASSFIKDELKTNSNINYNWGSEKVGSSNINDNVFIKFSGHITSNVSGGTLFRVKTDDGARLFFNNRQIIYSWKLQGPAYHQSENENLKANVRYPFVLEWYEHGGGAVIILEWKKPGGNWQVIPADAFSTNLKLGGTLSLASGISHYGGDYGQAEYYKIGNIVYVDGLIKGTDGKSHLATLPVGYRPDKRLIFNLNNHTGTYRLDVTVDGIIYWIAGSRTHNWLSLTGISFYVKG